MTRNRDGNGRPVRLEEVRNEPDQDTVGTLRQLLADAEQGRVRGALVAAHYGGREYLYAGSGSLCQDPRLGVAAVARLARKFL
jgi:hypothetical protein